MQITQSGTLFKIIMRTLLLTSFFTSLLTLLSGCATVGLWQLPNKEEHTKVFIYKDKVSQFFAYQQTTADKQTGQLALIPQQGIAFMGQENIYFVMQGKEAFLALYQNQTQLPLTYCNGDSFNFQYLPATDKQAPAGFKGDICVFLYDKNLTAQQYQLVERLGFKKERDIFKKTVTLEGIIVSEKNIKINQTSQSALDRNYQVQFFQDHYGKSSELESIGMKAMLTPVSIVLDIIIIPAVMILN